MDYLKYCLTCSPELTEILLAFLSGEAFEVFEETETGLNAFLPASADKAAAESVLADLQTRFDFVWEKEFIPYKNWNAEWESRFEPIRVGDFCGIRAEFHPHFEGVRWEITIQPKMAFGTGHHATTFLVMEAMEGLDFAGKKVLDYGCGTGILAILASKLGARLVDAVDIEQPAFENTVENCKINGVSNVQAYHGTLDLIADADYDIQLANINRNVILDSLDALFSKAVPGGHVLISGFLSEDIPQMQKACAGAGFAIQTTKEKDNWVCMHLVRK